LELSADWPMRLLDSQRGMCALGARNRPERLS
jgi:hypothetical protein